MDIWHIEQLTVPPRNHIRVVLLPKVKECTHHGLLRPEVHVIHHGIVVIKCTSTKDRYTPRKGVLNTDSKDFLVSTLNVWEPVLSSSLNVNSKDTNLATIKLQFFLRMLLSNVLIQNCLLYTSPSPRD